MKPPPAQEILESELGEPILARWHVGLGWTLAWTSDVKNLWAVEWLRWPQWGQFWGQLVREHMRQKKRQVFDMRAEIDPATGHVHAVLDADRRRRPVPERPRRDAHRRRARSPAARRATVPMPQTAPGPLRGGLPARPLRLVPPPRVAREGGRRRRARRRRRKHGDGRRELRPRDEPVPARVPRARAGRRDARACRGGDRRRARPGAGGGLRPGGRGRSATTRTSGRASSAAAIALFLLDLLVRRVRLFDRKKDREARSDAATRRARPERMSAIAERERCGYRGTTAAHRLASNVEAQPHLPEPQP